MPKKLKLGIICGGPSLERGISLNSARTVLDHLQQEVIEFYPIYVDRFKNFYEISNAQLYSNTPSDFDFKLAHTATKLNHKTLINKLKNIDLMFPAIHGEFGETGELQELLEKNNVPFVGSSSQTCKNMFHKYRASTILKKNNFETLPSELLKINDPNNEKIITKFFNTHHTKRVIVKPAAGGSSIGVFSAYSIEEAIEKLQTLFEQKLDTEAIIEPFCDGREFTTLVLQNMNNKPVALIPTEIQMNYENYQIFDYRRKYLPTANTIYHTPPRFDIKTIETIQTDAEKIFELFKMRDFVRVDGWVMNDGRVLFTDINPISGMEQNSFLFRQSSRIGMTHRDILFNIIKKACLRNNIPIYENKIQQNNRKPVKVLFGGNTAERQVSIMSGTNIWLKLRQSNTYIPEPYLLDRNGDVWSLPYDYNIDHTAEEIYENCITANINLNRLETIVKKIRNKLDYTLEEYKNNIPQKMSFEQFLDDATTQNAFVFLGLHGGMGEDGTIQQILDQNNILYNGPGTNSSNLCMDKYLTGHAVSKIGDPDILTIPKKCVFISELKGYSDEGLEKFWNDLKNDLNTDTFIIKPKDDGCSTGVILLSSKEDLAQYIHLVSIKALVIQKNTFKNQTDEIEMPMKYQNDYLIESFIETDFISIKNNDLIYKRKNGWLELTVGVLESQGKYYSLNPSITIAEGNVLSVEEKFQGGTGINITPPPENIVSLKLLKKIKSSIEKVAFALGIENYSRIDIFFNVKTGKMYVIEANTLPGLTPATVLYHQALAEDQPMYPITFLEHIIQLKIDSKDN